jgi:hypothetical protein
VQVNKKKEKVLMLRPYLRVGAIATIASLAAIASGAGPGVAALAAPPTLYVSVSGADANPCTQQLPCATLQHAVDVSLPGGTVKVWPGNYNQTVNITTPVTLEGSGENQTTIDGKNVDNAGGHGTGSTTPYYGVVSVQNNPGAGGVTTIEDFTIRNAFVTPTEYNEIIIPSDVSIYDDQNTADSVQINHVRLRAVQNWRGYGGIGLDVFNNAQPVDFSNSVSEGNFQGALLEGGGFGGAVTVFDDTFKNLPPCSGMTCAGDNTTVYPGEGLFVLSDEPGTSVDTVRYSDFYDYAGLGIAAAAGYSGGNCSGANGPCPGNSRVTFGHNQFSLGPCAADEGCSAIILDAEAGNMLTANIANNTGTVTDPDKGIVEQTDSGVYSVTKSNNHITRER